MFRRKQTFLIKGHLYVAAGAPAGLHNFKNCSPFLAFLVDISTYPVRPIILGRLQPENNRTILLIRNVLVFSVGKPGRNFF
jgi:hypothetical protein